MPNLTVRFDAFMQVWSAGLFRTLIVVVEQAVAGATALLKDPSIAWQVAGDMVFEVLLVCLENTRRGRGDGFAIQTRNNWVKRMDSSIPKPPAPEPTLQP